MAERVPYWIIYSAVVALIYIASLFIPFGHAVPITQKLADPSKATLDVLVSITQLISALDAALLGAAATLTVKGRDWSTRWARVDGVLVLFVFICGATSYYGTYLGYVAILGMLAQGMVNPFEVRVQWSLMIQYDGLVLGVFLLGLVFARMLEGRIVRTARSA